MSNAAKIRSSFGALLIAMLSACATGTGSGGVTSQTDYERTIPVCIGEAECRMKMQVASEWVAKTTGYELVVNTDERIETGGWGMGQYPAVRVERKSIGGGRHWILIEIDCGTAARGTAFGARTCPPSGEAALAFNTAVGAAH